VDGGEAVQRVAIDRIAQALIAQGRRDPLASQQRGKEMGLDIT
jgi:hypothetical protein